MFIVYSTSNQTLLSQDQWELYKQVFLSSELFLNML